MEYIGYCLFFGTALTCILGSDTNSYAYIAAAIGMGLCAIARAFKDSKKG